MASEELNIEEVLMSVKQEIRESNKEESTNEETAKGGKGRFRNGDTGARADDDNEREGIIDTDDSTCYTSSGDEKKSGSSDAATLEDFKTEVDDNGRENGSSPDKGFGSNSVGRRGDPRMHRAVSARRANPNMSLLEALIIGGFKFPNGTDGNGKSDRSIYDADNVLLCQRKNQLSRRLRLAKRRSHETKSEVDMLSRIDRLNKSNDLLMPSAPVASNLQRNPAMKRSYSGQDLEEQLAASRLKASDVGLDNKSNPYQSTIPQSSLTALLQQQQQRSLGQTQTYFGAQSIFPMLQQGLDNPYLQSQFPLSFALNGTSQSNNGNLNQNTTQSSLDQYLKMAASSMGLGHQSILFPQSNIQTTHNQLFNPSTLQHLNINADMHSQPKIDFSLGKDENVPFNENSHSQRTSKLKRAVGFFDLQKGALTQRCLTLAGFGESELKSEELTRAFEDMLRNRG